MNGYLQTSLAQILMRQGRYTEAEAPVRQALDLYARTLPSDHQYVAAAEYVLGEVLLGTDRLPDAEAMLTASMNRWKRTDAPAWRSARSASALGEALYREGHLREAEKYLVIGYRELTAESGVDNMTRQKAHDRLAHFYESNGESKKMEALSLELRNAAPPISRPN
jgi:predicted Zn-dependent protease